MRCILMGVTRHIEQNTPGREETAVQAMRCILMVLPLSLQAEHARARGDGRTGYALHPHGVTPVTASRTRQSERRQPYRLCAASSWALTRHIK